MKSIAVILVLLGASGAVLGKQPSQSMPQARAKQLPSNVQPAKSEPEAEPTSATSSCGKMLREIAEFTPLPDRAGPGECGASDRVRLDAIKMPDGSRVAMTPPATVRCAMAESIAEWVRSDLGKAAKEHGSPLKAVVASGSYDCRPRNSVKGAKVSEHGRGNAMDVAALKLANGVTIDLTRHTDSRAFRDKARASACSRFTTVLGPGADAHHENHIHVDLAARSRGHRLCQWEVRDEPVVASTKPAVAPRAAPRTLPVEARAQARVASRAQMPSGEAVPLPLRRPFELVFAMRRSRAP
jgi:hypothetical protein